MEKDNLKELRNITEDCKAYPLVSVAIIAYNVEKYIGEAIESVLNQRVSFKVEIVIGEDKSTDRTNEIIKSYQYKYSNIIRIIEHDENIGLTPNSIAVQNDCNGKYIALLDGDDYWIDSEKLQQQILFLENNPDYSATSHQSLKIYENGNKSVLFGENENKTYKLIDTIRHRKFHTSSLIYRKKYWTLSGGIPKTISSNERAIYPMLACYGNIYYFNNCWCVYRITKSGLNSRITSGELETDFGMIQWLKKIKPDFPAMNFKSFLHLCTFSYPSKVPFLNLINNYILFCILSFSYFPKNLGDIKYGTSEFIKKLLR